MGKNVLLKKSDFQHCKGTLSPFAKNSNCNTKLIVTQSDRFVKINLESFQTKFGEFRMIQINGKQYFPATVMKMHNKTHCRPGWGAFHDPTRQFKGVHAEMPRLKVFCFFFSKKKRRGELNNITTYMKIFDNSNKWQQNIAHLLMENHTLFKLLKYEDNDPISQYMDDSIAEDMITPFNSKSAENPNCRVFFRSFSGVAETSQKAQLRIYPTRISAQDVYESEVYFAIDIIVHMGIDYIKGGWRKHLIAQEIQDTLTGQDIETVRDIRLVDAIKYQSQTHPEYDGWTVIFSTAWAVTGVDEDE
jgi:hypothetical protein